MQLKDAEILVLQKQLHDLRVTLKAKSNNDKRSERGHLNRSFQNFGPRPNCACVYVCILALVYDFGY